MPRHLPMPGQKYTILVNPYSKGKVQPYYSARLREALLTYACFCVWLNRIIIVLPPFLAVKRICFVDMCQHLLIIQGVSRIVNTQKSIFRNPAGFAGASRVAYE